MGRKSPTVLEEEEARRKNLLGRKSSYVQELRGREEEAGKILGRKSPSLKE